MSKQIKIRLFTYTIYLFLIAGIFFESVTLARQTGILGTHTVIRTCKINLEGNIRKPGWYVVPEGTTQFEILKVAGVRPTSDLSLVNLSSQVGNDQNIRIGTLEKPVSISNRPEVARVEFFYGEVNTLNRDGKTTLIQQGQNIAPGDQLQTQNASQAEISIGSFSRIDIDNFSDLVFEKINQTQNNKSETEITQNKGSCWHRIVYSNTDEIYRIYTRSVVLTVGGSGADFLIDVQNDQTIINIMDGLLLVERRAGGESINMISGQSATIFDDERPFQITRLTPDISANEQFSRLTNDKPGNIARKAPLNFFFSVAPGIYYLVNLQFLKGEVHLIRIPGELLIDQFTQSISTIDQAFLYGGPLLVTSFLERLFNTRIQKYISCSRDDVVRIASALGGVTVDVDAKASSFLGLPRGRQKLNSKIIIKYLSPAVSGVSDANERQTQILRNLYEEFRIKNIVPTLMTADQILSSSETSFSASEIVDQYAKYNERTDWIYKEDILPVNIVKRNGRTCLDPILLECRRVISNEEK
jgi:hypothetical protein